MKIRIYQIDVDQDDKFVCFRSLDTMLKKHSGKIPLQIYFNAYEGDVDAKMLEDVFYIFNAKHPVDYRARSLSVSDVVEVMDDPERSSFYYCDTIGFKRIGFDPARIAGRNPYAG